MNVHDLFARLSHGHLSNLVWGADGTGTIQEEFQDRTVSFINEALTKIHSRFLQRLDLVQIEMQEGIQRYRLSPVYAVSNTTPNQTAPSYILDTTEEPFLGGVIRILSIQDTEVGENITPVSARALAHNTVFVKEPRPGGILQVEYQADHPRLSIPVDPEEEISLAPVLEGALEAWVAHKVFSTLGGENHLVKARELLTAYEEACQMVKVEGLLNESLLTETPRRRDRGFI